MTEKLTEQQLLEACSHALNMLENTSYNGCPQGFKTTYDLAAALDRYLRATPKP